MRANSKFGCENICGNTVTGDAKIAATMQKTDFSARNYRSHDELLDGRTIIVRSIRPEDKGFLQEVMEHLSARSRYFRFMTPKKSLSDRELVYYSEVDFKGHVALLACLLVDGSEVPVGIGRYVIAGENELFPGAELAFAVEDEYHGLGVATILLKHLAIIARSSGIDKFIAVVLNENISMLDVFRHSGLPVETDDEPDGITVVTLSLV